MKLIRLAPVEYSNGNIQNIRNIPKFFQKERLKRAFLRFFCKFLSDEVEIVFWEGEAKRSKLFISKFGHRKVLRKWFWSYLDLKNESSERLERALFSFFANFWVTKLKPFSGKVKQSVQNYLYQHLVIGSFWETGFEVTLS